MMGQQDGRSSFSTFSDSRTTFQAIIFCGSLMPF